MDRLETLELQVKDLTERLDALSTLLLDEAAEGDEGDPLEASHRQFEAERKMRRLGHA